MGMSHTPEFSPHSSSTATLGLLYSPLFFLGSQVNSFPLFSGQHQNCSPSTPALGHLRHGGGVPGLSQNHTILYGGEACHCFLWTWPCQALSLPAYRVTPHPALLDRHSQELPLSFHVYSNTSKRIQEAQLTHALATFNMS